MKLPCWLVGHRAKDVRLLIEYFTENTYQQKCKNCPKIEYFITNKTGRHSSGGWRKV